MAKITIELDDDNNEDQMKLARYLKSIDLCLVLFDMKGILRQKEKNGIEDVITSEEVYELLSDRNINIDELIE